jgi:hypothetical protein
MFQVIEYVYKPFLQAGSDRVLNATWTQKLVSQYEKIVKTFKPKLMSKDRLFKMMDEIEQARFAFEFMFRPKPGFEKNSKNMQVENDL